MVHLVQSAWPRLIMYLVHSREEVKSHKSTFITYHLSWDVLVDDKVVHKFDGIFHVVIHALVKANYGAS